VGDREAALDVVQDAFGRAIRRRRTFRGEGPLEAWIWRMVVNVATDSLIVRSHYLPLGADELVLLAVQVPHRILE
jgi:DNA-directed RNA polymerase specialized sigma24 family protein